MSVIDDTLLAELIELAKHHRESDEVRADTRLYADLGLTGDDAGNLMTAFAAKYEVDMSAFVWLRYFDNESSNLMEPAIALAACALSPSFAVRWHAAHDSEREITVAHLADVARAKVWRHPEQAFGRTQAPHFPTLVFSVLSVFLAAFFLLGSLAVLHAFLNGQLGDKNLLVLLGVIATGLVFPGLAFASWRSIGAKLASASGASETAS